jgi:cysteinyl-tRNA synthetase
MKFYNTLSAQKEEFIPMKPNEVKIYTCGPTVYQYAHIGNLRTYLFMDLLRRALVHQGYHLKHVMNITDVGHLVSDGDEGEDKMLKGAREQKKTPWEIASHYTEVFLQDIESLHIDSTEIIAKATDHIADMIEFVEGLLVKGYAYEIEDGIYFDLSKFQGYGKLSCVHLEDLLAGARVEIHQGKRHPADFALWKKAPKEHIMQWESPWGRGYPGWHIECSAMARKYLGDVFDIHTGGVDHIPIHHENEIAQSEALLGVAPVRYWMHGEFMMVNNGKMSKSLGNAFTLEDLKNKGITPLTFRYFCLNAHYRNKLNFTWEGISAAKVSYERFLKEAQKHKHGSESLNVAVLKSYQEEFYKAIEDDLNVPKALGVTWNLIRNEPKSREVFALLLKMDEILGLGLNPSEENIEDTEKTVVEKPFPQEVFSLVEKRRMARENKDWNLADRIRNDLLEMGVVLKDTQSGVEISWEKN